MNRRTTKVKSDILEAWKVLMNYAEKIDRGEKIAFMDSEMLIIGQIMAAKDRREWLLKISRLLRPQAKAPYTFHEIHQLIERERNRHHELTNAVRDLLSYMPPVTLENFDSNIEVPMGELLRLKDIITQKN